MSASSTPSSGIAMVFIRNAHQNRVRCIAIGIRTHPHDREPLSSLVRRPRGDGDTQSVGSSRTSSDRLSPLGGRDRLGQRRHRRQVAAARNDPSPQCVLMHAHRCERGLFGRVKLTALKACPSTSTASSRYALPSRGPGRSGDALRERTVPQGFDAERGGFEPPIRLPVYSISSAAPSATRTSLRLPARPWSAGGAARIGDFSNDRYTSNMAPLASLSTEASVLIAEMFSGLTPRLSDIKRSTTRRIGHRALRDLMSGPLACRWVGTTGHRTARCLRPRPDIADAWSDTGCATRSRARPETPHWRMPCEPSIRLNLE